MSRRPQWAAKDGVRLDQPSRRTVIGASAGAPLLSHRSFRDPAASASEAWLARQAEQERLGKRWQEIESRLFSERNWAKLSRIQRARHREQYEMDALSDRMDELEALNQTLLASLPTIVATTHLGICGKLAVAAIEACPEDHPQLNQLIASTLRDYRTLHAG